MKYISAVDLAKESDRAVITCLCCKKSIEIVDGKLPAIGWCGCDAVEYMYTPIKELVDTD